LVILHFINEDVVQNVPQEQQWVLELYNVEAAFLNMNHGIKMIIKLPDEVVALGFFITSEE